MKYVTYYRVSTRKQDLGLEAQRAITEKYINSEDVLVGEFSEKETGTSKRVRFELERAIDLCKNTGATLLIAKLDRLSRSVNFISALMNSGVEFKALDMPHANKLTIHIFSAIAEHEAELISNRTVLALNELKKKGIKLGKVENLTDVGRVKGVKTNRLKAKNNSNNRKATAYIKVLREKGLNFSQIAKELNSNGFVTSQGKSFQSVQVQRLHSRS